MKSEKNDGEDRQEERSEKGKKDIKKRMKS